MSWSFSAVGKPEAVLRALESQNSGLTGQSKAEWDEAKPGLAALIGANVGNAVRVNASGHATFETTATERDSEGTPTKTETTKVSGQCGCTVEPIYGFVE